MAHIFLLGAYAATLLNITEVRFCATLRISRIDSGSEIGRRISVCPWKFGASGLNFNRWSKENN